MSWLELGKGKGGAYLALQLSVMVTDCLVQWLFLTSFWDGWRYMAAMLLPLSLFNSFSRFPFLPAAICERLFSHIQSTLEVVVPRTMSGIAPETATPKVPYVRHEAVGRRGGRRKNGKVVQRWRKAELAAVPSQPFQKEVGAATMQSEQSSAHWQWFHEVHLFHSFLSCYCYGSLSGTRTKMLMTWAVEKRMKGHCFPNLSQGHFHTSLQFIS